MPITPRKPRTSPRRPQRPTTPTPAERAALKTLALIIKKLDTGKAEQIQARDIRRLSALADYVVIATGTSPRHTMALGYHLEQTLRTHDIIPLTNAGDGDGSWVIVDLGNIIVHLLTAEARTRYDLESLWRPSRRLSIPPPRKKI